MDAGLAVVFLAGLATLATPCILPVIPLYLAMLLGSGLEAAREPGGRMRLVTATLAFAVGFTAVFTVMGLGASTVGALLTRHREMVMGAGGALIVLFGLKYLGLVRIPWLERETRLSAVRTGSRLGDAAVFGVVFALGWTPCVGPILGSVLTYTAARATDPLVGAAYLATYAAGVALPLVALSVFLDRLLPLVEKARRHIPIMEKVTGAGLAVLGAALVVTALVSGAARRADPEAGFVTDSGERVALVGQPTDRPRLVELYRTDCPVCQKVMPDVERLRHECVGRRIRIQTVDISDPANVEAAAHFGVTAVPTFVLLDASGVEQARVVGGMDLVDLRRAAASLMQESCTGVGAGALADGEGGCPGLAPPGIPAASLDSPLLLPTCGS